MAVDLEAIRHLFSIAKADGPTLRDEMAWKMISEIESLRAEVAQLKIGSPCPPTCPQMKNFIASINERDAEIALLKKNIERHRAAVRRRNKQ